MGHQIIRQPNGNFCVWSSHVDSIILFDATAEDLIEYYAKKSAEDTKRDITRICEKVSSGQARIIYHQFTKTYSEALAASRSTNSVEPV